MTSFNGGVCCHRLQVDYQSWIPSVRPYQGLFSEYQTALPDTINEILGVDGDAQSATDIFLLPFFLSPSLFFPSLERTRLIGERFNSRMLFVAEGLSGRLRQEHVVPQVAVYGG